VHERKEFGREVIAGFGAAVELTEVNHGQAECKRRVNGEAASVVGDAPHIDDESPPPRQVDHSRLQSSWIESDAW
jgi:hypothetical protein